MSAIPGRVAVIFVSQGPGHRRMVAGVTAVIRRNTASSKDWLSHGRGLRTLFGRFSQPAGVPGPPANGVGRRKR